MGRKFTQDIVAVVVAAGIFLLASCGGSSSASGTITPAAAPSAALAPSSLAFGNENVGTTSAAQTVTLANNGNAALLFTGTAGIAVTGTDNGDFSQTNVCGTSLAAGATCNIVVTFTPSAAGSRAAALSIADNATDSPQSVSLTGTGVIPPLSISPTSSTVLLGATQSFALTADATCASSLFGNVPVTGSGTTYTAAYTAPQAVPSAWTDTVACTATIGGAKVTSDVTLQYPTPTIASVNPTTLGTYFSFDGSFGAQIFVNGNGFLPDADVEMSPDTPILCSASLMGWTQLAVGIAMGGSNPFVTCPGQTTPNQWDPGFFAITDADPATGHGGGISNQGRFGFLGDQNLLAFNATDAFLLDPGTNTIHKFKLSNDSPDGNIPFTGGTGYGIAVDNTTGDLVLFAGASVQAFDPTKNTQLFQINAASDGSLHGGTAMGGWAFLTSYDGTQGLPNVMDVIDLTQPNNSIVHASVKGTPQNFPWNFQLTTINGNLMAVVWSVDGGVLSTVGIPSLQVAGSVTLPKIATATIASTHAGQCGWQLQVFNSGPAAGTAVLLSQYDQVLVYVNLANMTEIRRVDLTQAFTGANPPLPILQSFRIGKDEADGSIVVAFADPMNGQTVLYNVDANGKISPLTDTAPFLATGIQESPDGTQIYWGNRDQFAVVSKK